MDEHKFRDIWKEQCAAARSVRAQHGLLSALDYLIGEKLLSYAETAMTRPEFARELPRFVAEVRDVFSGEEIRHYLDHLERMAAIEGGHAANLDDGELFDDPPDRRAAKRVRIARYPFRRVRVGGLRPPCRCWAPLTIRFNSAT